MFDVVTFDCYGTLIDWESGIWSAFRDLARIDESRRIEILEEYAAAEAAVEGGTYRSYYEVMKTAAVRVAAHLNLDVGDGSFLPESLPSWKPFPDTNPALERMRRGGIALAILSNVDDELLEASRSHLMADFEFQITAQQIRSYKPSSGHFDAAGLRTAGRRWLHAAQSYFHDIVPTSDREISNAWINRKQQVPDGPQRPSYEFEDLGRLADSLGV